MSTDHDDVQTDHAWENRRLILAALAPRTATRPARHRPDSAAADADTTDKPPTPGLLARCLRASGRAARAAGRQFHKWVPPNRRIHTAVITTAVVAVLLVALAGVKYLTTDVATHTPKTRAAAQPPPVSQTPLTRDTTIRGVHASDMCPRDPNYSDANLAFDGDLHTAWVCTRAKNQDGQVIQVDFGRQVTLTQIRIDSGFDSIAPDGTDQWSKHRIVTKIQVWFPKELNRQPVTIDTGAARDYRGIPGGLQPPATVNKLLIRIAETTDPPQPAKPTNETSAPSPADETTTVAISEIQFIGYER